MLSPQQYDILRPHIGAIKLSASSKVVPSTAPWEAMQNVNVQLGNRPADGYCPNCVMALYEDMARLIEEYENKI